MKELTHLFKQVHDQLDDEHKSDIVPGDVIQVTKGCKAGTIGLYSYQIWNTDLHYCFLYVPQFGVKTRIGIWFSLHTDEFEKTDRKIFKNGADDMRMVVIDENEFCNGLLN